MKNAIWTLALCALTLASCSRDESSEIAPSNTDQISFRTNTTRATVISLNQLESDANGFIVYASSGANAAWYTGIDGTNNYLKGANPTWKWKNTPNPLWPTAPSGYPMNFYAYFATNYTGLTLTNPLPAAMVGTYVIQPVGSQVDLMAAKASVVSKPASGTLPLTFTHTLSKINFGMIPGLGATVHLQSLNVNNVGDTRPYDFIAANWTSVPATFIAKYAYKTLAKPATIITGVSATETEIKSVVPTTTDLMLMPQVATTWTPVKGVAPANAYMGLIYRMGTAADPNAVGYLVANSHPGYDAAPDKAALNGKPLFVSVGYPFAASTMTWEKGKGYTYNICLGTANATNGYLLDNRYYDENGNPTSLTIGGKDKGDPINNGDINFLVSVTDWGTPTETTIQ